MNQNPFSVIANRSYWRTFVMFGLMVAAAVGFAPTLEGSPIEKPAEDAAVASEPVDNSAGEFTCRLIAVSPNVDDKSPDATKTTDTFASGKDVTFVVELKNVGTKPATLLGVRLGDSFGKAKGKLSTKSYAPHLFELEYTTPDGTPIHRPKREYVESILHLYSASTHQIEPGKSLTIVLRPAQFASPMAYDLPPGSYRAKVRYRGPTEKIVNRIKEVRPDKAFVKAWRGEATSNEVTFTIADDRHAPRPVELKWGEPNNGLRAAVSFRPMDDSGSSMYPVDSVPVDSKLDVTIHFQNVSEEPISLVSETWRQGDRATVRNEAGELREVGGSWYSGWDKMVRWNLKPGEVAEVQSVPLLVMANQFAAAQMEHPIGRTFTAEPGNYSVRYTVRLGNRQTRDGKGNVILPGPNDWQGELVTGETPLEVLELTTEGKNNSAIVPVPRKTRKNWLKRHAEFNERAKQGDVDLVFIGDSITEEWDVAGKEVWAKYYGSRKAVNFGFSGDRTENILWRLQNGNVDGIQPKLVVLMIGTNNYNLNTAEEIAAGITANVELLREKLPKSKVLLMGLLPRDDYREETREQFATVNAIVEKLSDDKSIYFLDMSERFLMPDGSLNRELMPDLVHLGEKGHAVWAEAIEPLVSTSLEEK